MTSENILNITFKGRGLEREVTIKEYLITLLELVWKEKECFDGKRPFGYSGWEYDVYRALIENSLIPGKLRKDGGIDEFDIKAADAFVLNNIIKKI